MGTAARSPRNGRKTAVAAVKPARRDLRSEKLAAALAGHKEAVEQQAATAEILRAISRSSGDPQPVFQAIVDNAHRLCGAMYTVLYGYDGEMLTVLASKHMSTEGRRVLAGNYPQAPSREKIIGRTVIDGRHFHSPDIAKDARFPESTKALPRRAVVAVPLINKGAVVGAISCGRAEAKAFSTRDISLLQTFADQAVIVIENARLFNQTKEALEQQTATSSILAVISSSPTDLAPVFDAILSKATALCEAHLGLLHLYDGEKFRTVAHRGDKPEYKRWVFERGSFKPEALLLDLAAKREPIHIADIRDTAFYRGGKANAVKMADIAGGRSFVAVPLLKERQLVGSITIYRPDVRPFTAKQIALLQTFADQAVIAIENVRLFNGTKEALEQQTATSEVLKTISRSTFDLN